MELTTESEQLAVSHLPAGWEIKKLGDIGQAIIGLTYDPSEVGDGGRLVLRSSNIQNGKLVYGNDVFVRRDVPERLLVRDNDILICVRNGSRDLIGKAAMIQNVPTGTTFGAFMAIFRTPYAKYVFHQFRSDGIKNHIRESLGATINQITNKDLRSFEILFPKDEAEQRAIAEVLSDVDALIGSLEALIEKKRAVKQGAMQQLLTASTRLTGFSDYWCKRKIGELTRLSAGGTPSTLVQEYWGGQIPWMTSGDLHQKRIFEVGGRITAEGLKNSPAKMLPVGCILIGLAGQGKTRGTVAINEIALSTNQSVAAILPSSALNSRFVYYNLDLRYEELRNLSTDVGGRGGLNLKLLGSLEINLPSISEQTAIADVLSDMDAEIEALEARLAKTRLLKQGMMQQLLTGRIRLL